jgi:hypothetical protein
MSIENDFKTAIQEAFGLCANIAERMGGKEIADKLRKIALNGIELTIEDSGTMRRIHWLVRDPE